MPNKLKYKAGDIVKIIIDCELTQPDGIKFNVKDRYGLIITVHEETLPNDYYIEIQGKPNNPYWFTDVEIEKVDIL